MRRATKTLAFMLVFIMVIATFAGLNLYDGESKDVYAGSISSYKIVKIGNASGTDITTDANRTTLANKIGVDKSNLTTAKYDLSDIDVVRNVMVGGSEKKTIDLSKLDVIDGYDMVIIDLDNSADLNWETAFELYCRIIGLNSNGKGMKYLINTKAFSNPGNTKDILTMSGSEFRYYYHLGGKGNYADASTDNVSVNGKGFSKPIEKLFLMLNVYNNPATFYSLFCTGNALDHGINISNGMLKGMAQHNSGENSLVEGMEYDKWSFESLKPYWMMSATNDDLDDYGYNNAFGLAKLKTSGAYCGATNKGREYGTYYFGDPVSSISGLSELLEEGGNQLGTIIKSDTRFYAYGGLSMLVVEANYKYEGSDLEVEFSGAIARDIYNKYMQTTDNNNHMKPPIGGVNVDLMSMYEFNATTKDLNACYDAIYFGKDYNTDYSKVQEAYGFSGAYARPGTVNVLLGIDYPEFVDGVFNNWQKHEIWEERYSQGNDLSSAKETAINNFKGVILRDSGLVGTTRVASADKIKNVPNKFQVTNGNFNGIAQALIDAVEANKASLTLISAPPLYTAENYFDYHNQNSADEYFHADGNPDNSDYINGYSTSRDMVFTLKAESFSSGDYTIRLLIDLDADGYYDKDTSGDYKVYGSGSISSGEIKTFTFTPLANNYVGSVPWRLDLLNSSADICDSIEGMSACKTDDDSKIKINVLQIVIDTQLDDYSGTDSTCPYNRNTLYIPTADEIADAKALNGSITSFSPDTTSGLAAIRNYFNGIIDLQYYNVKSVKYDDVAAYGAADKVHIEKNKTTSNGNDGYNSLVYNAGLFYYFMANLDLYEMNTQRISLYQLENCWRNKSVDGDVVTGSTTVPGREGNEDKTFTISYNKSNGEISYTDCNGKTILCDVLVTGFSDSMVRTFVASNDSILKEELHDETVELISKYIKNNRNALVGRGIVDIDSNEKLTKEIQTYIGMASTYTLEGTSVTEGNGGNAQAAKINEGSLTRFPYSIPKAINTTNTHMPKYNLNINNKDIAAYYANTRISARGNETASTKAVGNAEGNYYMYRIRNLTYVNIGFAESQATGQKSSTIKLPEAGLLANTIANYGTNKNPVPEIKKSDIDIKNPGTPKKLDDNYMPLGGTKKSVKETDYFYVDYEVSDTGTASGAMEGDKFVYTKDGITYQRVIFTAANGPATLEIKAGDTVLNLPVYEYTSSSNKIGSSVSELKSNGLYAVDVPISQNYYTGIADGFGFGGSSESFTLDVTVKPKTGATADNSSFKEFVFTKRGLFMIN